MNYTNLRDFERHLSEVKSDEFSAIYLIISEESFERKRAIDCLLTFLLKGEENRQINVKTFSAEQLSVDLLLDELDNLTLFSERQIILLQEADQLSISQMKQLEKYFVKPNPSSCFLISAASVNHATNFYKKAAKAGVVLEFVQEKPWEKEKSLIGWLNEKVVAEGKKIDKQACQQLVKQAGSDASLLNQELEKLLCYVGDCKEITLNDVEAIGTAVNSETIWQLGEAIFRLDDKAALRAVRALLADGLVFLSLLRQIRTQFQTEFQICSILGQGGTASDVTQQFSYLKGFVLEKHLQMARNYGLQRFQMGMKIIDDAEMMSKSNMSNTDLLAEMVVIKLTNFAIKNK